MQDSAKRLREYASELEETGEEGSAEIARDIRSVLVDRDRAFAGSEASAENAAAMLRMLEETEAALRPFSVSSNWSTHQLGKHLLVTWNPSGSASFTDKTIEEITQPLRDLLSRNR